MDSFHNAWDEVTSDGYDPFTVPLLKGNAQFRNIYLEQWVRLGKYCGVL